MNISINYEFSKFTARRVEHSPSLANVSIPSKEDKAAPIPTGPKFGKHLEI